MADKKQTPKVKICPFCNAEINESAKKCRFCDKWLDEEIACPVCGEKIKSSAKKCRFCGEWLGNQKQTAKLLGTLSDEKIKKLLKTFVPAVIAAVILIAAGIIIAVKYVPVCSSSTIRAQLAEHLKSKYNTLSEVMVDSSGIKSIEKRKDGYSCSANIDATTSLNQTVPVNVNYSYSKAGIGKYNLTSSIVLPDCYDDSMKKLLVDLIKDSSFADDNVDGVNIEYATITKFEQDIPKYQCSAKAVLKAKPGRALVLNWWDAESAKSEVTCSVYYNTSFCDNGITSCVTLKDISGCKYD